MNFFKKESNSKKRYFSYVGGGEGAGGLVRGEGGPRV